MVDKSFWDFESSSKIDVLVEGKHTRQVLRALVDVQTKIIPHTRDELVFHGRNEALLVKPRSFNLWCSILLVLGLQQILAPAW